MPAMESVTEDCSRLTSFLSSLPPSFRNAKHEEQISTVICRSPSIYYNNTVPHIFATKKANDIFVSAP